MYANCVYCGKFTQVNRIKSCAPCFAADERMLLQAIDVLNKEGRRSIFDLADRLSLDPERIFRWLEQGRIAGSYFQYMCPRCGKDLMDRSCECHPFKLPYEYKKPRKEPVVPEVNTQPPCRRVQQKCDQYWDHVSSIRRKQKRDIWLVT